MILGRAFCSDWQDSCNLKLIRGGTSNWVETFLGFQPEALVLGVIWGELGSARTRDQ